MCTSDSKPNVSKQDDSPYIMCLKNYDIEELLEEERVFREQFYTTNMDPKVIEKIEQQKKTNSYSSIEQPTIQGEPYYQPFKNFDLWLKFNS